jgi:SRSO17 transposase
MHGIRDWSPSILEKAGVTADKMSEYEKELNDFLDNFADCFTTPRQMGFFTLYINGLMSDLERKTCETIVLRHGKEKDVRLMQLFMKSDRWDHDKMKNKYHNMASNELNDEDGMLILDGADIPKKGKNTVGVARQYCGALGKTDNCLAFVMASYSSVHGTALIDSRLYLPEKWLTDEYAEMRQKCGIPESLGFMTKNEIATDIAQFHLTNRRFQIKWVGADAAFGHDSKFLDSLPNGVYYYVGVHSTDRFFETMPDVSVPAWSGIGRIPFKLQTSEKPKEAKKIVDENENLWQETVFGCGSKGLVVGHEMLLRVWAVREGLPTELVWLHARRLGDGSIKYSISNAQDDTPPGKFTELALRRWPIEQCFEECKSDFGLGHHEGRSWTGWENHVLIVSISHFFLQCMRRKFMVGYDDLSRQGQTILKAVDGEEKEEVSIMTLGHMRTLFQAVFTGDKSLLKRACEKINYQLRSYAKSFISYFKKTMRGLSQKLAIPLLD